MVWEDFVEAVKTLVKKNSVLWLDEGKLDDTYLYLRFNGNALVRFSSYGDISIMTYYDHEEDDICLMENRSFEQMLEFIKSGC